MFFKTPRLVARICAISLTAAALFPAAKSFAADEAASLERTRAEIAAIKKRLSAAKGQEAAILKEVRALDSQIAALNRQISSGEHDISELESEMRSAEARIAELKQKYELSQEASNERARKLYKAGPAQSISHLLEAKSLAEFVRLTFWWQVAAELDGRTMLSSARLRSELMDRREDLVSIKSDLERQKGWLEEKRQLIASARRDRTAALQEVQKDIAHDERHIRELEAQSRALTAALRSRVSRSSGAVSTTGFIWPLNGRVTSEYGYRRGGFHPGIDIDGNTGDAIRASKAGTIVAISCGSGYGICTVIDHGGGVSTLYAHMSRKAVTGGHVERGQVIGYVGCTGSCTGSHLHFEVRVDGEPRNPRNFLP